MRTTPRLIVFLNRVSLRVRLHETLAQMTPMTELFCVSENFCYRKSLCMRGVSRFSVKFFCLRVPKNFVGEPFCVPESFRHRIEGGIMIFRRIFFVSQNRKFSYKGSFGVCKYWPVLGINCPCMLKTSIPGKTIRKKKKIR